MYNKVNPMYDAYDILSTKDGYISEMSRRQQGFLCGLIKKTKPNKILEIGVAEGGTTASVMKTLSLLGMKSEVFSVDLATKLYNNYNLDCGYLYKEWKEDIKGQSMHKFLLGKTVAAQMDNIGKDVDFCIGKKVNITIDSKNSIDLIIPIVCVEVKTYLDATMFGEVKYSSMQIKNATPNARTYILMEGIVVAEEKILAARHDNALDEMFVLRNRGDNNEDPISFKVLKSYYEEIVNAIDESTIFEEILYPGKLLKPND